MPEYHEGGLIAEVDILEDNSDDEWERYKLRVISTRQESPMYKAPKIGEVFTVEKTKGEGSHMAGWHLF